MLKIKMSSCLVLFSIAVSVCQVHSQLCSPPILPSPCPSPCVPLPYQPATPPCPISGPTVVNPNPCVIIDNSVSNALINALQLLIVSNLIGGTIGPSAPLLNNLGPLLDSLVCSNPYTDVAIPEFLTYSPNNNLISLCNPVTTCSSYYDIIPPCGSGPVDPYAAALSGLSDIYPNLFTYTETITPMCIDNLPYNGYSELLFPLPGIETICPSLCNGLAEIIPNYINYPVPEISPPLNPYCSGYTETISPITTLPNMYGCLSEVVTPYLSPLASCVPESPYGPLVIPNYYGGLTELSVPCAEALLPSTIPAPLICNYGYPPTSLPCIKVNVEPLAYDNYVCNGYSGPIYY